jgi:hypothetical protein
MNSAVELSAASYVGHKSGAGSEVSLFRLYTLRLSYLVLALELGVIWLAIRDSPHERVHGSVRDSSGFADGPGSDGCFGA